MNNRQLLEKKLASAVGECATHQSRLQWAWDKATLFMPLRADIDAMSNEEILLLDQVVFRFSRLQDALATRLLPTLLQWMEEWQEGQPFLDKLNRAEKLAIIPSVEGWIRLRELRNQTAHEYPDQPELVMDALRLLFDHVPQLIAVHQQMAACANHYLLTPKLPTLETIAAATRSSG